MVKGSQTMKQLRGRTAAAVIALSALSGCGGGSVGSTPPPVAAPAPTPTPAPAPTPTPTPTPSSAFQTSEFNRSDGPGFHNAIPAWAQGATGTGVTIAVIDSGIDSDSPEFAGRISAASADVAGSRGLDNAESDHGTNVAMIAAAARDNTGIVGIAFNSTIAVFRADTPGSCADPDPDKGCSFSDTNIAAGVDRAVAAGAKVINLSLGGSLPNLTLRNAIVRASAAGAVVIVSAGNDGDSTKSGVDPNNPDPFASGLRMAGNGNVIIVGSVNDAGVFSAFSNRAGSEASWFLSALGERVCCVYENGVLKVTTDSSGGRFVSVISGTSFSAPQVAGAAALLRQAFPNLTATEVVDLLLRTAREAGAAGTDATYGRGILDIGNAFAPQGTTSLANGTAALPLGDTTIAGSSAMGDAGKTGSAEAVILDGYKRAYTVDLAASARGAAVAPRLANALAGKQRNLSLGAGKLALAFTVDGSGRGAALPWTGQLRLSREAAERARVLAARVVAQTAPGTRIGFAYRQGADGLVAQLQGRTAPAFLIAGSPSDDYGFIRGEGSALALRHELGKWGLTVAAYRAKVLPGAPAPLAAAKVESASGVSRLGVAFDRRFGTVETSLGASWLAEDRTVLGARLHPALGANGADSLFLDATAGWQPAASWRLGASWRRGDTFARSGGAVAASSRLTSSAWAFDVSKFGVVQPGDVLSFRLAQPLRVGSGGLNLTLPVAYSYDTLTATLGERRLSLAPAGRERVAELAWRGTLWDGAFSTSLYARTDPGHYAALPNDYGVAASWSRKF